MFRSVDDVDLFILGLAERPLKGSLIGPTFACIISKQFQKVGPITKSLHTASKTVFLAEKR